jgi:hypothetical protein
MKKVYGAFVTRRTDDNNNEIKAWFHRRGAEDAEFFIKRNDFYFP